MPSAMYSTACPPHGRPVASFPMAFRGHQRLPAHSIKKQQVPSTPLRSCATPHRQILSAASIEAPPISREDQLAAAGTSSPPDEQQDGSEASARQAGQPSTSGSSSSSTPNRTGKKGASAGTLKQEALQDRQEVADKLITVFMGKAPAEWRKLIAFSKRWPTLADRYSASLTPAAVHILASGRICRSEQVLAPANTGMLPAQ